MAESRDRSRSPIRDYQSDPAGRPPPEESAKLYIGNLAWFGFEHKVSDSRYELNSYRRVDSNTLRDEFGKIGTVTDAYVANDRETGRSRGFGFVTFADAAQAREAKEKLDNADLGGRLIRIVHVSFKALLGSVYVFFELEGFCFPKRPFNWRSRWWWRWLSEWFFPRFLSGNAFSFVLDVNFPTRWF